MPHGKKYTAAEKHFNAKAAEIRREIKVWRDRCAELTAENSALRADRGESI